MEDQRYKTVMGTRILDLVPKRVQQQVILDAQVIITSIQSPDGHVAKTTKYMESSLLEQVGDRLKALVSSIP